MLKISLLAKLNLIPNYIYETIVTTYNVEDNLPNAAPMGIMLLDEQKVVISPFVTTQTFKNIKTNKAAVINFTQDLEIFYRSTFSEMRPKLPEIVFEKANEVEAPVLKDALAFLEIRAQEIQIERDRSKIIGEIARWVATASPFHPLNRGYNLVLESLVHATRIIAFKDDMRKVTTLKNLIKRYQEIVEKVAPTGKLTKLMVRIQNVIEKELGD
ncbi:MAG: DUF447 family protein [Candidatus Helarchaeota archaeon]|nr:DUF447 family protein [Candidatus Helarchaeota archaeon]